VSWDDLETPPSPKAGEERNRDIEALGLVFSGEPGRRALAFLRRITIERRLPPSTPTAELHDMEGQRRIVGFIERTVTEWQRKH
jgi:hypothetical protein